MTRLLGLYLALVFGSEAVTIEVLRLCGTLAGASAAVLAAYWSYKGRRELRTRRFRVRDPDNEHAVVVDAPPHVTEHALERDPDGPDRTRGRRT